MSSSIRDWLLSSEIFLPGPCTSGKPAKNFMFERKELLLWTESDVFAELVKMSTEGLVSRFNEHSDDCWRATTFGKIERERMMRRLRARANCLQSPGEHSTDDLILSLAVVPHVSSRHAHSHLYERTLELYLHDIPTSELAISVQSLASSGYIELAHVPHLSSGQGSIIRATTDGLRLFLSTVRERLGIDNDSSILDAASLPDALHPALTEIGLDTKLAELLHSRLKEAKACEQAKANLAATVLYGSVLEGVLTGLVESNPREANTSSKAPKEHGVVKKFNQWKFADFISVSVDVGWIPSSVHGHVNELRDSRNLVHAKKQWQEGTTVDRHLVTITSAVLQAVLDGIHEQIASRPV